MDDVAGTVHQVSQLRALLFTDLCDSTSLVEHIGDSAAAALFQQHDRLVMALQQRWNGQQIDRSDGLFVLFERPADALGFALDYQQGLTTLGHEHEVPLQARAGLHVGEVILWENSVEAIALGAKPVEVEGLAKPMAARLMQLAQPGQILVSATAESMARRAGAELGDTGKGLRWKSFGRWRFKGVAQPMEVFAVMAANAPSSGRPRQSAKAMRDVPLWRRPYALAAQLALVVALLTGGWFLTRPQPAIAFGERDWVVVGDLRNLTGEALLDGSLQQAFRISLEQSRYVNVVSDLRARETLKQMRLNPEAVLDSSVASEVAQRLGARLLLMPTIAEVGGRLRLTVEIVDPQSSQSLSVASVDGKGLESVLGSTDRMTSELRHRLGEASERVLADSAPLPAVTTASLDALRAYALGQSFYSRGDYPGALSMYEKAVLLDPTFALAWMAQVRARFANVDHAGAMKALEQVDAHRARLPPRESLYLDAWRASLLEPGKAGQAWVQLAALYPDYLAAHHNAAIWLYSDNRLDEALVHAERAADPRFELANVAQDQMGRILVAKGDGPGAHRALQRAVEGGRTASRRYLSWVAAVRGEFAEAERVLALPPSSRHAVIEQVSLAADQRQWNRALQLAAQAHERFLRSDSFDGRTLMVPMTAVMAAAGDREQALRTARLAVQQSLPRVLGRGARDADTSEDAMVALGASLLAARLGDAALGEGVVRALEAPGAPEQQPLPSEMVAVVKAEIARGRGQPALAMQLLQPWLTASARYQTRVVAMDALHDQGNTRDALQMADGLAGARGLAYAELDCGYCFQTLNVIDSNRARDLAAALRRPAGVAAVTAP